MKTLPSVIWHFYFCYVISHLHGRKNTDFPCSLLWTVSIFHLSISNLSDRLIHFLNLRKQFRKQKWASKWRKLYLNPACPTQNPWSFHHTEQDLSILKIKKKCRYWDAFWILSHIYGYFFSGVNISEHRTIYSVCFRMKGKQWKQEKSGVTIQKGQTTCVARGTGLMLVRGHAF